MPQFTRLCNFPQLRSVSLTVLLGFVCILNSSNVKKTSCFSICPTSFAIPRVKKVRQRIGESSKSERCQFNLLRCRRWKFSNRLVDEDTNILGEKDTSYPNVVLVAGFESFNRNLYNQAAKDLPINLQVFSDSEIRSGSSMHGKEVETNPVFVEAVTKADVFIGSLIFDYDDALAVQKLLPFVNGPRLVFESATELMSFNRVGSFSMEHTGDEDKISEPPPVVKTILSKFSSGKEEDKMNAYLKMLKVGPNLLKFVPGEKAADLRMWLEAYRYWNQGGATNVASMLQLITSRDKITDLPELEVTPDVGLLHPFTNLASNSKQQKYFSSPSSYLSWRMSASTIDTAKRLRFKLASSTAPKVAILLFRKHVITEQSYIMELIQQMEQLEIIPVPIFINGVEAHTIVRDWLTSSYEEDGVARGEITRDTSYQPSNAVKIDAVVNTIGFPLVGGPGGTMEAGRNVAVAETLLRNMNVPYFVACPLLLQSIDQWRKNGVLGLQSVVLYSLPELDGAIDAVVLGGLVGDEIVLVPERVKKLATRIHGWVNINRVQPKDRKIAISLYGFPPNVGAVGTAALLDVPASLKALLMRLHEEGYNTGSFATDPDASGESLVAALAALSDATVISTGANSMQNAIDAKIQRAIIGDQTVAATLSSTGGGLGGGKVRAFDISLEDLEEEMGKYMMAKVHRSWSEKERGPGVSQKGNLIVSGIQVGNIFVTVQPLLGFEGDPMRLLFQRDLTPHPQYCAAYKWLTRPEAENGIGAHAIIHFGMHGTVEWLPGQPLGNDRDSWSDELLGGLPNIYLYAANNPSESILAKRRGYGTLISYNVPPYGRADLYLDLSILKDLVSEYRTSELEKDEDGITARSDLRGAIWSSVLRCGLMNDVPLLADMSDLSSAITDADLPPSITPDRFDKYLERLGVYLVELQDRLFSSGLHVLGSRPSDEELLSYLQAFYGDALSEEDCKQVIRSRHQSDIFEDTSKNFMVEILNWIENTFMDTKRDDKDIPPLTDSVKEDNHASLIAEASNIIKLLDLTTEELDSVVNALSGGFVPAKPGGDLLRDGLSVLPTGRNIHALDPYRMPSASAWARGQRAAEEIIRQHKEGNDGKFPETIAVTLWGLDAIKTRGESVAIVLALVGATPIREGTGRVVRFDLIPIEELGRPRIDILASLSGIFRDSFANIVDLLDDMFERASMVEDEPTNLNFVKKHALELSLDGVDRPAARLFSNPPGDYGSMVNEVVGSGDWNETESLGDTWAKRNSFSYGRNEGEGGRNSGIARPLVLDKLLASTERVVQEIDSVEYGLTDIQEYYANTGALKLAAENRKPIDQNLGKKKKVAVSVIEAFGGAQGDSSVPVRDVEDVLRLEYRSKLLNPKWRDAMLDQGSGGVYEVSQRMTAMVGWAATCDVDNFVFDQASERYALDEEVAKKMQMANPEAFKNVLQRLLEANGRGMWQTDEEVIQKLKDLYNDADDMIEQSTATV